MKQPLDTPAQERSHMCRSIKQLRQPDRFPTDDEIQAAALQFVRKVSGYRKPSRVNEAAFNQTVAEVAAATRHLLQHLTRPE
jgi:hypothetical protein